MNFYIRKHVNMNEIKYCKRCGKDITDLEYFPGSVILIDQNPHDSIAPYCFECMEIEVNKLYTRLK